MKVLRGAVVAACLMGFLGAASAEAATECLTVDARKGWQTMESEGGFFFDAGWRGAWSVDAVNYDPVGPFGHSGSAAQALQPYEQYKYETSLPFGAMLVEMNDEVMSLDSFVQLLDEEADELYSAPHAFYAFRINDSDRSLGDNGGAIELCFEFVDY
ncbi:hypothetical protein [Martelella soudanensis]|uniref:hypothetical protein n=1 Tax=unclassified Martelella TaxID=2629616 RepID=UPI0015DE8EDA|nr:MULTISPECIES: hypothetical protein [unclassified Martelella]